ncbi:2TM domain-containing protein [Domibacillus aminovorans]|uniref:2TM domain-containing protein n=1 Tax=Domibacillus aminovorans TaxID=29332 RepID=UPI000A542DF7
MIRFFFTLDGLFQCPPFSRGIGQIHLTVYVLVNAFLFGINLSSNAGEWWFIYPLGGWGIGLLAHGISTFACGKFGVEWEERKVNYHEPKGNVASKKEATWSLASSLWGKFTRLR